MNSDARVCALCGSDRLLSLPYTFIYKGGKARIVRCQNCRLGFIRPMPSPEVIEAFYSEEYFNRDYHCGVSEGSYADEVSRMRADMRSRLSRISRFQRSGKFLEIGCAGGAALAETRAFGFDTVGVELSTAMAEWGRKKFGLDIRDGTLEAQRFPEESFDAVFMGDVIEHLREPAAELREIHRVMKPGGILVLEYPMDLNNIASRARVALRREKVLQQNPYHLYFYTPAPLSRLLASCGFQPALHKTHKMVRRKPLPVFLVDTLNAAITRMTGKWGDRGFTIAIRP
jgi:SAM-dependent methyltransferase